MSAIKSDGPTTFLKTLVGATSPKDRKQWESKKDPPKDRPMAFENRTNRTVNREEDSPPEEEKPVKPFVLTPPSRGLISSKVAALQSGLLVKDTFFRHVRALGIKPTIGAKGSFWFT